MQITRLDIRALRSLRQFELAPAPGLNLITGDNGAGKTSVLEAIHLLAYGRSFRGRVREGLVNSDASALEVFAEWQDQSSQRLRRAGLRHSGHAWEGRLDGAPVTQLGDLCAALAAVTFEAGSHALVSGGGESRRRYVDWGLFHVEHAFTALWRRYARALKQRNRLLKQGGQADELDVWDRELAESGEPLTRLRQRYLDDLQTLLQPLSLELAPMLGMATFVFVPGWRRDELSLADALLLARDRDRAWGFTSVGAHRADWRIRHEALPNDETRSRGQAKLTALACVLAQAEHYVQQRQEWPVVLLDDLASELDRAHQARVLQRLAAGAAQVFVTGTEAPADAALAGLVTHRFHVEHGQLSR
ncbi:MAG: DNA replication/repair protein RecF [Luteimonas sp.]